MQQFFLRAALALFAELAWDLKDLPLGAPMVRHIYIYIYVCNKLRIVIDVMIGLWQSK